MWNAPTQIQLAKLPPLYRTENVPTADKLIRMHFFLAGSDWYAVEFDGEDRFFGFAILNGDNDMAEWGYFSLSELKGVKAKGWLEVERDMHWNPKPVREINKIKVCRNGILEDKT